MNTADPNQPIILGVTASLLLRCVTLSCSGNQYQTLAEQGTTVVVWHSWRHTLEYTGEDCDHKTHSRVTRNKVAEPIQCPDDSIGLLLNGCP